MDAKQLTERQAQIADAAQRIIATEGSRRFPAHLLAQEVGLTGDEVREKILRRQAGVAGAKARPAGSPRRGAKE